MNNDIDKAVNNLKLFADFCTQKTSDHPYLKDDEDSEDAQLNCANDIYLIINELEKYKELHD